MSDEQTSQKRQSYADENDRKQYDEYVEVPFDNAEEQAILLLAAAEEKGIDPSEVRTGSGSFIVPKELESAAENAREQSQGSNEGRVTVGGEAPPETIKIPAGPTGEVETNASEDAESGTVQDTAAEADAPRSNIDTVNQQVEDTEEQGTRRRAPRGATKKAAAKESSEAEAKDKE